MNCASDRSRKSTRRPCIWLSFLLLAAIGGGCKYRKGSNPFVEIFNDIGCYIAGSGERGKSGLKCDDKGEGCLTQPGVDSEPVEHARPLPLRPDQLSRLTGEQQRIQQASPAGLRGIFVGEMAAEIVDLQADTRLATINLTGLARRVAVSDDAAFAVVSVRGFPGEPQGVDILDLETMQRTGTVPLPGECGVHPVAFIPGSHDFFVGCRESNSLHRFAIEAGTAGPQKEELSACDTPQDLTFTADGDRGLITCTDTVWVYDVPTQSVVWRIEGFVDARNVTARLDGTRAYITDQDETNTFQLVTINLATYDRMNETQLEGFPTDLFLGAQDTRVYTLNGDRLYVADADGSLQSSAVTPLFALTGFAVDLPVQ